MVYSKAKLESSGDKASPYFRTLSKGKLSDREDSRFLGSYAM
jgi:hypothetical protein